MWETWNWSKKHEKSREASLLAFPSVLLSDESDHVAPPQCIYWSTVSNCLVSSHPESTLEEVAFRFCPNCSASEGSKATHCTRCYQCPLCDSVLLSKPSTEGGWVLACVHCDWDSSYIGLREDDADRLGATLTLWLSESLSTLKDSHPDDLPSNPHTTQAILDLATYNHTFDAIIQEAKDSMRKPSQSKILLRRKKDSSWLLSDTLAKLEESQRTVEKETWINPELHQRAIERSGDVTAEDPLNSMASLPLEQRLQQPSMQGATVHTLLPHRVKLIQRSKKRAAVDSAKGHTGILAMPRFVQGLNKDRTQWFDKLKLCSDVFPQITVARFPHTQPTAEGHGLILLKLSNKSLDFALSVSVCDGMNEQARDELASLTPNLSIHFTSVNTPLDGWPQIDLEEMEDPTLATQSALEVPTECSTAAEALPLLAAHQASEAIIQISLDGSAFTESLLNPTANDVLAVSLQLSVTPQVPFDAIATFVEIDSQGGESALEKLESNCIVLIPLKWCT